MKKVVDVSLGAVHTHTHTSNLVKNKNMEKIVIKT